MKALPVALTWAYGLAWGFGQVVRDLGYPAQLAFFLPAPTAAAALVAGALFCGLQRRRRLAIVTGLLALVPLTFMLFVENRFTPAAASAPHGSTLRLVHWNVRKGRVWDRALPLAVDTRADLYAFSEPPWGRREREVASARGFTAPALRLGEQLALAARGSLGEPEWLSSDALHAVVVPWHVDGRTWRVLLVDLYSDVRVPRDAHLRRVRAMMEKSRVDVVLGDLNAPRRSRALDPPPAGFVHAYDAAGRGWSATWPMPLPLWSIDQCLVGPRLRVVGYRLQGSSASDHRMQVIDVATGYDGTTP